MTRIVWFRSHVERLLQEIWDCHDLVTDSDDDYPFRVGTAAGSLFNRTDATGTEYTTVLAREFDVLTAENDMKADALQPTRGAFRWTRADSMVDFATRNGMLVRGHTLVWHQQNPAWLTSAAWTADQLRTLYDEHVTAVVSHFRGKLVAWDVVNEAVDDAGVLRGGSTI